MVEHINTRPDQQQTRNSSKYQLIRYPNQETYLFKSARSPFSPDAKIGIRNPPRMERELQFNWSKQRIENSLVGIPRKLFSNKNEFIDGNEFQPSSLGYSQTSNRHFNRPADLYCPIGTFPLIRSSRIQPQDFIIGLFNQFLKIPNNNNSYQNREPQSVLVI
jgi:hypothetical protein